MKSWKWKILVPVILLTIAVGAKYVLWDFPVSSGKRVGNLTKISKKGKLIPTWEGTIDEGSGDKLTTYFSVKDDALGEELYAYEGKEVILYYDEFFMGWPRNTKYVITSWKSKNPEDGESSFESSESGGNSMAQELSKTLFCSLLGTLYTDQELYQRVKTHIKENNLYLFNQFEKCNE